MLRDGLGASRRIMISRQSRHLPSLCLCTIPDHIHLADINSSDQAMMAGCTPRRESCPRMQATPFEGNSDLDVCKNSPSSGEESFAGVGSAQREDQSLRSAHALETAWCFANASSAVCDFFPKTALLCLEPCSTYLCGSAGSP